MGTRLVLSQTIYLLKGVKVDYNLTPEQTVNLLPDNNTDTLQSEERRELWHGGKTGVVEATIPILWDRQPFTTTQGRQKLEISSIGFAWPVEIASLALPENNPEQIRNTLYNLGIFRLVALQQKNDEFWSRGGHYCSLCLFLYPDHFKFCLSYNNIDWDVADALVGASQLPK